LAGVTRAGEQLRDGDIVVLAQKIVSKAEGRYVRLADVEPSGARQGAGASRAQGPARRRADAAGNRARWCAIDPM
jgi:coenzyme F420-0:L-glutamate ligase/coenzyme F420-1:gamma-L-glutamate ligase